MAESSKVGVEVKPSPQWGTAKDNANTQQPVAVNFPPIPATINSVVTGYLQVNAETHSGDVKHKWYQEADFYVALFTFALVFVTARLVYFTRRLWNSTKDLVEKSEGSTKTIERAYVKLSPYPPGIQFADDGVFNVSLRVENFGNTPADITDVLMKCLILDSEDQLPESPSYQRTRTSDSYAAFLVKGEWFTYWNPEWFTLNKDEVELIKSGRKTLFLIGYVDYTDRFGTKHRAGFARYYWPSADNPNKGGGGNDRQNLYFVRKAGYNYDEEREPSK